MLSLRWTTDCLCVSKRDKLPYGYCATWWFLYVNINVYYQCPLSRTSLPAYPTAKSLRSPSHRWRVYVCGHGTITRYVRGKARQKYSHAYFGSHILLLTFPITLYLSLAANFQALLVVNTWTCAPTPPKHDNPATIQENPNSQPPFLSQTKETNPKVYGRCLTPFLPLALMVVPLGSLAVGNTSGRPSFFAVCTKQPRTASGVVPSEVKR